MGWMTWLTGQIIGTTLVLGNLQRHQIIVVNPQSFKNDTSRVVVTRMINAGEDLTVILEQLYASASDKLSKK